MIKNFCDICGEEIVGDEGSRFKVKREWNSFHEWGWEQLHVHKACWADMCRYIRERKANGKAE